MLLRELVEAFNRYNRQNRAPRTAEFYADHLAKFLAKYGDLPAENLRPYHILEFKPTWHLVMSVQRLFRWAVDEMELLPVNPVLKLKRPRLGARKRVLTRGELCRLLRGAPEDFRRFLLAARESAARPQELRELSWDNLQWEGDAAACKSALYAGKAYFLLAEYKARARRADPTAPRIIPISPRLGRLLWRLLARQPQGGHIFLAAAGVPWNRNSLRCRMRRLRLRVDVPLKLHGESVCCYTLRHSAATTFAARGMQTSALQQLLGHSNIRTTQRYVHLHRQALLDTWRAYWRHDSDDKKSEDRRG